MMDITEQRRTYAQFLSLTKWGIISCVVILSLMAFFLA